MRLFQSQQEFPMAAIRAMTIAGAALLALAAAVPARAQTGAPLQLLPGPDQATQGGRAVTKAVPKKATKKATKTESKTGLASTTKRASQAATKKTVRATAATTPRAIHAAQRKPAQRAIAAALPEVREQNSEPLAFAPMPSQQVTRARTSARTSRQDGAAPPDNVMRDGDSVTLVGRLPWWRNDRLQEIRYGGAEAESKVLAAADAWLAANDPATASDLGLATHAPRNESDERIIVADASEPNALDLAIASAPEPSVPAFWHSLIAILGGALAAGLAAVASARFLFA
jgi:hypothetical protein